MKPSDPQEKNLKCSTTDYVSCQNIVLSWIWSCFILFVLLWCPLGPLFVKSVMWPFDFRRILSFHPSWTLVVALFYLFTRYSTYYFKCGVRYYWVYGHLPSTLRMCSSMLLVGVVTQLKSIEHCELTAVRFVLRHRRSHLAFGHISHFTPWCNRYCSHTQCFIVPKTVTRENWSSFPIRVLKLWLFSGSSLHTIFPTSLSSSAISFLWLSIYTPFFFSLYPCTQIILLSNMRDFSCSKIQLL